MSMAMDKYQHEQVRRHDHRALAGEWVSRDFTKHLGGYLKQFKETSPEKGDVNIAWRRLVDGSKRAESQALPLQIQHPRVLRMSSSIMHLIDQRARVIWVRNALWGKSLRDTLNHHGLRLIPLARASRTEWWPGTHQEVQEKGFCSS